MTVHLCPRPFHRPPRLRLLGVANDGREDLETKAIEELRWHAGKQRDHVLEAHLGR